MQTRWTSAKRYKRGHPSPPTGWKESNFYPSTKQKQKQRPHRRKNPKNRLNSRLLLLLLRLLLLRLLLLRLLLPRLLLPRLLLLRFLLLRFLLLLLQFLRFLLLLPKRKTRGGPGRQKKKKKHQKKKSNWRPCELKPKNSTTPKVWRTTYSAAA